MPIYEYLCQPCNGIFEELRPIRESSEPVPCPQCFKDASRIMPTSFAAFVYRDGYPRRIPDDGKFYHLGHKVSTLVSSGLPNEHPEVNKKPPKARRSKAEKADIAEMRRLAAKGDLIDTYNIAIVPADVADKVDKGYGLKKGTSSRTPSHLSG